MKSSARILGVVTLLLSSSAFAFPARPQNPSESGTATISGHVTSAGKGAGSIVVVLTKAPVNAQERIQQLLSEGTGGVRTTSDIDGSYRFSHVPSGHYVVHPFAPAYVSSGGSGDGTEVTVNDGDAVGGIDFRLERGGVLTGKVTGTDGRPIIGATVSAQAEPQSTAGVPPRIGAASLLNLDAHQTDDRGVYRIYGLPAGTYVVQVVLGSALLMSSNLQATYFPGVTDAANAGKVSVTAGAETAGVDIKVTVCGSATYRASGRVVDDSGNPVAAVQVVYGPAKGQQQMAPVDAVPVTTNSAGEFHIQGLHDGSYQAWVFNGFSQDSDQYSEAAPLEIKDADASGIEIHLHQGGTVAGTVVIDGGGDPDAAARLTQQQVTGIAVSSFPGNYGFNRSPIAADGTFTLHGLPPGRVQISLGGPLDLGASSPFAVKRVEQDGSPVQGGVNLEAGQHLSGITVVAAYANCSISGTVIVQGGKLPPGTGLTVNAMAVSSEGAGDTVDGSVFVQGGGVEFDGAHSAEVDANGLFQIVGLVPGSYRVSVQVDGPAWADPMKRPTASKTVAVTSGSDSRVELDLDLSSTASQKDN